MRSRWPLAVGAVAIAGVGYWMWPRDRPTATPKPVAAAPARGDSEPLRAPAPRHLGERPEPTEVEPPRVPTALELMPSRVPQSYTKPGSAMRFIKQVEAKPDPELEAAERLEYKRSRLRFRLADAAAECYDGADDKASAQFSYTLVVKNHRLRVENVKLIESTLGNPQLEDCMISQIQSIDGPADLIPDMREDGSSAISLHDLYVRTRSAADAP